MVNHNPLTSPKANLLIRLPKGPSHNDEQAKGSPASGVVSMFTFQCSHEIMMMFFWSIQKTEAKKEGNPYLLKGPIQNLLPR